MKLLTSFIAIFFVLSFEVANGQLFVGGSVGFNTSGGSTETNGVTVDHQTNTNFSFSPSVGYFLTDKFAVGGSLSLLTNRVVTPGNTETVDVQRTFGISPFVRYYAYRLNKFSIFGTGYLGLGWNTQKSTTGPITTTDPTTTMFRFGVTPSVSYDLTDKISLEAGINLLSMGYNYNTSKASNGDRSSSSNFYFGAGVNNLFTTGSVVIGAIIKL